MQTAPGQAVKNSSNRDSGTSGARRARRRGLNPWTIAIAGILLFVSVAAMVLVFFGYWPPKAAGVTVAQRWMALRTATPSVQRAMGLQVEKLGPPRKDGDTIIVRLKVTNKVLANAAIQGTPTPGDATPTAAPAAVYNGTISVIFYNVDASGNQVIVGGGVGSVVDLPYGQSKEIEVRATPVSDFSDATQYDAFPENVWTDKDPKKGGNGAPEGLCLPVLPNSA